MRWTAKKPYRFRPMMQIDAHVHLYPAEANADPAGWAAARGESLWATLVTRVRRDGGPVQSFPSVDELLREMDRAGLQRAVLQGWYWQNPATCRLQNRFFADCIRAHPDRLLAFAALHPGAGFWPALEEMHRARDAGFAGFGELSPHAQGMGVDDAVREEMLVLAGDWKMPVTFHVTDPDSKAFPGRVETPLSGFVALARRHPATTLILAHWGSALRTGTGASPRARASARKADSAAASGHDLDSGALGRAAALARSGCRATCQPMVRHRGFAAALRGRYLAAFQRGGARGPSGVWVGLPAEPLSRRSQRRRAGRI